MKEVEKLIDSINSQLAEVSDGKAVFDSNDFVVEALAPLPIALIQTDAATSIGRWP